MVALWSLGLWMSVGVIVQSVVQWQCIVFHWTVFAQSRVSRVREDTPGTPSQNMAPVLG